MKLKISNVGYLLLIIGIIITATRYVINQKEKVVEKNKVESTILKQLGYAKKHTDDLYDAVLSIPQISLKRGLYEKEDERNNIEENITIHEMSDYPDVNNSNLILMAHSGTGKKAFFNDLDRLNTDSLIEFYYQGTKYVYKIDNFYIIDKTGTANINRDINKKTITLITCSQKDKTKQLVYIGYLIDEIKY